MNDRKDPEKLLEQIQAEEQQDRRGKLKIYLGAAPGVGKTYTMLKDAKEKKKQGLEIVLGVVESHSRKDIEELMQGFPMLPKIKMHYKGIDLEEFDLDAALNCKPDILILDELAHSNIIGMRHEKRWQDVKEVLDRGIDVYTTLNVMHIESLNNDVSGIIHAPIKETVPDSILDLADTIELVDLPPEDLLKRLQDGKVYYPAQADLAKDKFFRKGNLIALRELALRITAERVGAQVLLYRQGQGIQHIWSSSERILVCVGPGKESMQLIRVARRLATSLQGSWVAVYFDAKDDNVTAEERNNAIKNLRAAEQLGAETAILSGINILTAIIDYSREQNVSLIMVWKHIKPFWKNIFKKPLADHILNNSEEINVYIITGTISTHQEKKKDQMSMSKLPISYVYVIAILTIAFTTIASFILYKFVKATSLSLLYLFAVVLVSLLGRVGPSIMAAVLSIFSYTWFFYPGLLNKSVTNLEFLTILLLMIILVQVISNLSYTSRRQAESARSSERRATALNRLSQQLASARGVKNLLRLGANYIAELFSADVMVLMLKNQQLEVSYSVGIDKVLDAKDIGVAQWVFDLGQVAGLGTDTLSQADAIYVPLLASQNTMGVLRICPKHPDNLFTPDQMLLLNSCANQFALTLEVDQLQEQRKLAEISQEIDHTRNVLLQSVSQDLRAPIAAILLTAGTQMQMARQLSVDKIHSLGQTIYNEAEHLSRLINNLLQITYLESNAVKLNKEPSSLLVVINKVIKISRDRLGKTPVYIDVAKDLPMIPLDRVLLEAVLQNLLDNALKFAPAEKTIEISAEEIEKKKLLVAIEDRGPGINNDEGSKLFEKFYKGEMLTTQRGLGLGLAICRMIIEAHGGKIWVENRKGGGATFKFTLPLLTP